ncbi:GNAT family N-acetyltransferase [Halobacillus sp. H74]|uniref:GNAT family N-acetyltransferase n=1 Tax=Halobacillus sp. H74 TaxID=3457436 RepID=UPI003FCD844D
MKIREMKTNEIDDIKTLRLESYNEYEELLSENHWSVLKKTLLSDYDLKTNAKTFVVELDDNIVGSVVLFPPSIKAYDWNDSVQNYPEIRMLSVNPSFRGRGIAKALLKHCIQVSKEEKHSRIGLHSASFMNALPLYEKLGFEHFPELDFEPLNDGIIVQGFIKDLKTGS